MPSIQDQLDAARTAHNAAAALETQARARIATEFDEWAKGTTSNRSIRHRLEGVIRAAYRANGRIAREHVTRMSELPGWTPQSNTFSTDYLKDLLKDVRRNLKDYNASDKSTTARTRAISRIQHSAGVAAERGYTDATLEAHDELDAFGFRQEKFWLANFVNNTPCIFCRELHGTKVGLKDNFHAPIGVKVYRDLQGPPLHPRCHCYIVVLIFTLANSLEPVNIDQPPPEKDSTSTDEIQGLSAIVFLAIVKALQTLIKFLTKG